MVPEAQRHRGSTPRTSTGPTETLRGMNSGAVLRGIRGRGAFNSQRDADTWKDKREECTGRRETVSTWPIRLVVSPEVLNFVSGVRFPNRLLNKRRELE